MTCKMEHKCIDCEHLELDKFIFITSEGDEEKETCYHCRLYDKYSNSLKHMKVSNIMDNKVYIQEWEAKE